MITAEPGSFTCEVNADWANEHTGAFRKEKHETPQLHLQNSHELTDRSSVSWR